MVEGVEQLRPELNNHRMCLPKHSRVLEDTDVCLVDWRAVKVVPRRITIRSTEYLRRSRAVVDEAYIVGRNRPDDAVIEIVQ